MLIGSRLEIKGADNNVKISAVRSKVQYPNNSHFSNFFLSGLGQNAGFITDHNITGSCDMRLSFRLIALLLLVSALMGSDLLCRAQKIFAQDDISVLHLEAEHGNADAQFCLGTMYHTGIGVPQDGKKAFRWSRKAAEQGHEDAQHFLGSMYITLKDYREAFKWIKKAAEQGNADSQCLLGVMYRTGKGVSRDYVKAYGWCNLAAAQGKNPEHAEYRDECRELMTPQQITEGQKLSSRLHEGMKSTR